jgi:hypothetical protein
MHNEQIIEAWQRYLKDNCQSPFGEIGWLFRGAYCGTCTHWFLINEDGLDHLATEASPREYYDEIIRDLNGKRIKDYKEHGKIMDVYSDYRFYGWCRRFPPVQRRGYSILRFRSLLTFLSDHVPKKVAEYDFPLMPHDS